MSAGATRTIVAAIRALEMSNERVMEIREVLDQIARDADRSAHQDLETARVIRERLETVR